MMDFTIEKYRALLMALQKHSCFCIRHDVDLRPSYSLRVAQVESSMKMTSTYYFRTVPESYDENIIQQIVSLGHRAGYHYECLTTCHGDMEAAYKDFCNNLEKLRKVVPIDAACAHGSPRSPYDSQDLWKRYSYRVLGITHESMIDTDFSQTLYLTDTGRRWDGWRVSVRDKVPQYQEEWIAKGLAFHSTDDIIRALNNPQHPIHQYKLLVNTHPQRWMPFGIRWIYEAVGQNLKNIVKRIIVCSKS